MNARDVNLDKPRQDVVFSSFLFLGSTGETMMGHSDEWVLRPHHLRGPGPRDEMTFHSQRGPVVSDTIAMIAGPGEPSGEYGRYAYNVGSGWRRKDQPHD